MAEPQRNRKFLDFFEFEHSFFVESENRAYYVRCKLLCCFAGRREGEEFEAARLDLGDTARLDLAFYVASSDVEPSSMQVLLGQRGDVRVFSDVLITREGSEFLHGSGVSFGRCILVRDFGPLCAGEDADSARVDALGPTLRVTKCGVSTGPFLLTVARDLLKKTHPGPSGVNI